MPDSNWYLQESYVSTAAGSSSMVFIAVKGGESSFQPEGDVGLDDISVTAGTCSGQPATSAAPTSTPTDGRPGRVLVSCDFDVPGPCGFQLGELWALNKGVTPTANTGPSSDHTSGDGEGTQAVEGNGNGCISPSVPSAPSPSSALYPPFLLVPLVRILHFLPFILLTIFCLAVVLKFPCLVERGPSWHRQCVMLAPSGNNIQN
jgi:hypothetical protein